MASYNFPLGVSHQDRNFNKILQIIRSFRGYETLEDLKAADDQVRRQLVRQLDKAEQESAGAREKLAAGMHLRVLPDFDAMVGRIRGDRDLLADDYRGKIVACHLYRPEKGMISELYELDFRMLSDAENVYNLMQEFARMDREDMMLSNIYKIDVSLREMADSMNKRGEIIGCMID